MYLHLVDVYGKSRYINIPYMDGMGYIWKHSEIYVYTVDELTFAPAGYD